MKIDKRVRYLVDVLNGLVGVTTFSSCGGHARPQGGQVANNRFYVCVDIDRTGDGWQSLEFITWAVHKTDPANLSVSTWISGEDQSSMAFEIAGKNNAEPDELAECLMTTR